MKNELQQKEIIKPSLNISKIVLGTVQFGYDYGFSDQKNQIEVNSILNAASEYGINLLDTAREYGDSEKKIGVYIKKHENRFLISTKLKKINKQEISNYQNLTKIIYNSVEKSLSELGKNHIDILFSHQSDLFLLNNRNFWRVINELKKNKLIKSFGISVYDLKITKLLIKKFHPYIDFIQIPYNLLDRRFESIFDIARSNNIILISRSTYLKGLITCENDKVPEDLKDIIKYKKKINYICSIYNITPQQLALNFVLRNDYINYVIIGVNNLDELKQNMDSIKKINRLNISDNLIDQELRVDKKDSNLLDPRKWRNF
jgi:aryl-alcohol dehydrogenase-like predicted oxidoreductase